LSLYWYKLTQKIKLLIIFFILFLLFDFYSIIKETVDSRNGEREIFFEKKYPLSRTQHSGQRLNRLLSALPLLSITQHEDKYID